MPQVFKLKQLSLRQNISLSIRKTTYIKLLNVLLLKIENTENSLIVQKVIKEFQSKSYCHYWIEYCAAIKSNYTVHVVNLC